MLAHSVTGMMEKTKDYGQYVNMVVSAVDMIDKFSERKSKSKIFPDAQELDDDTLNALLEAVSEEDIRKLR